MGGLYAQLGADEQFLPGTMLGKYELLATIATGGMASVILARQRGPAGFEKVVVIKVVHPHLAKEQAVIDMLLDEARVAAQITHANVVHTYELGEAHGTFYIVMEYLAGESLNRVLRLATRGPQGLTPTLAARIVADAAAGLHAAHELTDVRGKSLGLVHRDVSPGNILVLYNGGVKVLDFGIAKAEGRVTSTQDGQLKGKYSYMSPEQIQNEPLDRRSDVFSLGVVLWETLAQRPLFKADSVGGTLMQVLNAPRLPPSRHRPDVPPGLDHVALRALAPDPRERFQTAAELRQAIEDVIWQARCGEPEIKAFMWRWFGERMEQRQALLARASRASNLTSDDFEVLAELQDISATTKPPRKSRAQTARVWRPRAWLVAIGAASALAIGVGVALLWSRGNEPANTETPVAEARVRATPAAEPAPPVEVKPAPPAEVEPAPPPAEVEPEPAPAPAETAPAVAPKPAPKSNRPAKPARVIASKPTRPAESKPAASKPVGSAADLYQTGTTAYLSGDFAAAEAAYKQALAIDRNYAPVHRGLGFLYQRTGDNAKAIDSLKRYLKLNPNASDAAAVQKRIDQMGG
jgi:serine/threonine-protein kinase